MGTKLSLDVGRKVSKLVQRTLCDTNSQQHHVFLEVSLGNRHNSVLKIQEESVLGGVGSV